MLINKAKKERARIICGRNVFGKPIFYAKTNTLRGAKFFKVLRWHHRLIQEKLIEVSSIDLEHNVQLNNNLKSDNRLLNVTKINYIFSSRLFKRFFAQFPTNSEQQLLLSPTITSKRRKTRDFSSFIRTWIKFFEGFQIINRLGIFLCGNENRD